MYDIEKLVDIVCGLLEAEMEVKQYNIDVRKQMGCAPDCELWIPSLGGSEAWQLGVVSTKSDYTERILADVCEMLDVDMNLLIATVKSMQRKEKHNGRWDNPNYTSWIGQDDKKRLARFLANDKGEHGVYPWYESTGRKKAWCA